MEAGRSSAVVNVNGVDRPLRFNLHPSDDLYISQYIAQRGQWEPIETAVVVRLLEPAAVFVDCGANLGWYTVIAAAAGADVVAFEPEPRNLDLLRENIEANGVGTRVTVHPVGLGREAGTALLSLSEDNKGDHRVAQMPGREGFEIEVVTLDQVLGPRTPRILKIDTQGSEVAILRGARQLLTGMLATRSALIVEFWPHGLAGCGATAEELLGLMLPFVHNGFGCFEIDEELGRLIERPLGELAETATFGELSPEAEGHTNVLLIHPELTSRIGDLVGAASPASHSRPT